MHSTRVRYTKQLESGREYRYQSYRAYSTSIQDVPNRMGDTPVSFVGSTCLRTSCNSLAFPSQSWCTDAGEWRL
jgi:hypothetical protein